MVRTIPSATVRAHLAGLAIDVNAPDFTASAAALTPSKRPVTDGDAFTVDVALENLGDVTAEGLSFALTVPGGLALTGYTTDGAPGDIGGNPVDAAALAAGAAAGSLAAGQTRNLQLASRLRRHRAALGYPLSGTWSYSYQVCTGDPPLPESFTQVKNVAYQAPPMGTGGAGGEGGAATGPSSSSGGGGSQAGGNGAAPRAHRAAAGAAAPSRARSGAEPGCRGRGCSCGVPRRASYGAAWLAALALVVTGMRRRGARALDQVITGAPASQLDDAVGWQREVVGRRPRVA